MALGRRNRYAAESESRRTCSRPGGRSKSVVIIPPAQPPDYRDQNDFATTMSQCDHFHKPAACLSGMGVVHRCVAGWMYGRHG